MTEQHDIASAESRARRETGLEVLAGIDGEQARAVIDSLAETNPALAHHIAAWGFGDVYARPGLDPRSRQLVTLGILTALGGTENQLRVHVNTSLNVGITREEINEVFLHSAAYAGFPRAINATLVAREVFAERDSD
ncbi:Carboxymuconolactone decarboxylase OS=Tsukamurella paurometabola (strain ATCC 8368 / DSM / CCUG 35730 / CIP 100753 / JCM 10117 / KCTC 9821 / NBRC 16120/ NCIMB 702349 / NCTC 13040) OX=521096 GN=Tpau_4060 PE=4 SV=1 [Tsukamurella paurometabola]|uniref:Carboxymuconolactone decarboxylase n=1 Tax=Tsukamurella paurometabola (strain ATCC 8368 / DSM 20162 / CCUG 35730 / CIP 100753 / JCM 10117 / KCTC 9821 / NBRC 16120 / NCIMB 702349 / NCTC 13040) TaxID=521096 RepID=D5UND5_TSUPD|nr:carboxymuconolactone decarboxylase family protein [Tsukamurella paurometabola]ADG80630.1 Carboxymuconolactone decarboxylase [Tsukamurella paurometabola DSM 20162]SUP40351.1 4-carboxymuconolactone decarboxylase [Tsukamurella paurometabola]